MEEVSEQFKILNNGESSHGFIDCCAMWWLDVNISEDHAAFIFRVEVHGERKVDIAMGRV
jgi:hypothetical protein